MKIYSLTTQYKSWTKETLISILDELGHTDYRPDYNKAELANELFQYYNVETVLNAADIDALRRLFEVLGAEEIYRVVTVEGGVTPSPQDLNAEILRNILVQFQQNLMRAATDLFFSDANKDNEQLFLSISMDTLSRQEMSSILDQADSGESK